jgi:hypothetical protein
MTNRERLLAIIEGCEVDRMPFVQYSGIAAPDEEVWALIGRDNMGLLTWCGLHAVEHPNCRFEGEDFETNGRPMRRSTLHTPAGSLEATWAQNEIAWARVDDYVKEPADYHALLAYLRDAVVRPAVDGWLDLYQRLGEDGLPHTSVGRTPYQALWIEWVALEDLIYHMADCPELLEEVFAELTTLQHRIYEVVAEACRDLPVPYIVAADNVTAPAIGEPYFRRFCLPAYQDLADCLATTGKDIRVSVHMDGDLKPLWQAVRESPVTIIDSFSPPPDNDTSVADARREWPEMRLGVNYPSSVHLADEETIYRIAREIVEQDGGAGRTWIQISENVPPNAWRKSYPQIVRALQDSC